MAKPTIEEIIEAISSAGPTDRRKLKKALATAGISSSISSGGGSGATSSDGFLAGMSEQIKTLKSGAVDSLKESFSALAGPVERIQYPLESINAEFRELRQQNEAFIKAGYSKKMMKDFGNSMSFAFKESMRLTGNIKAGTAAVENMRENFDSLAFVNKDVAKSLMGTAAALETAGYDTAAYARIVDTATMAFGMNGEEINSLTSNLMNLQKQFALNPRKMMQDYDFFAKNFAYTTDRLNENFAKLQKMSRTTGIGFQKLAGSFGENMDSFEGSAQMAGKLNQILGKSMFNSIDLLNKTEAERAETIRKGLISRFGSRVGQMQKFELKAVGKQLNMSADETKRFLTGTPLEKLKDLDEKQAKMTGADKLNNQMEQLTDSVRAFQTPFERTAIALTNRFRNAATASDMFAQKAGGMSGAMERMSAALAGMETVGGDQTASPVLGTATKAAAAAVRTALNSEFASSLGSSFASGVREIMLATNKGASKLVAGAEQTRGDLFGDSLSGTSPREQTVANQRAQAAKNAAQQSGSGKTTVKADKVEVAGMTVNLTINGKKVDSSDVQVEVLASPNPGAP